MCRSRVAAKKFVFIISRNFREIINFVFRESFPEFYEISRNSNKCRQNFVFCEIVLEFREISRISNNFVKILCFAISQQPYVGVAEKEGGGSGGARRVQPCAPSPLMQIVPILASIYNVFRSVFSNSVVRCMEPYVYSLFSTVLLGAPIEK